MMNTQKLIIWNVLLSLMVLVQFYFLFTWTKTPETPQFIPKKDIQQSNGARVVYVQADSLMQHYEFFKDKKKSLENKRQAFETEFAKRLKAYQEDMQAAESKAPNLSQMELQQLQQKFMHQEQELMKYKEKSTETLLKEEEEGNTLLFNNISQYLHSQKQKLNFDYVMSYTKGGVILYSNDSLDITADVIKGLNQAYQK